jgi:hypothetical protein
VPETGRTKRPIIYLSCLEEFDWPKVGEFEVAIRATEGVTYFPRTVKKAISTIEASTLEIRTVKGRVW